VDWMEEDEVRKLAKNLGIRPPRKPGEERLR